MMKTKWIDERLPLPIILLGLLLSLTACSGMTAPPSIPTQTPSIEVLPNSVSASAEVVPEKWANLAFNTSGQLVEILVSAGDIVETGQVLAKIDDRALQLAYTQAESHLERAELALRQLREPPDSAAVAAAKAVLANAEANFDRLDRSGARQIELDAAQAQIDSARESLDALNRGASRSQVNLATIDVDVARSALEQARLALEAASLIAPFDGEIVEITIRVGELVTAGQPAILLADMDNLVLETTDLNEVDASRVEVGDQVTVNFDAYPDKSFTGTVMAIARKSSPGSAVNYKARIKLDEFPPTLRWGMSAFVVIRID